MICVSGAGGMVGRALVAALRAAGVPFRSTWSSLERAQRARALGLDAVAVDYRDPGTLAPALSGCSHLFLLAPNAPDQTQLELNLVAAALRAGVTHIVKQSIYGVDNDYELALVHRPVERAIVESDLRWTFLRPNSFMQNVETYLAPTIRTEDAFYSASGGAAIAHVDVRDIADVAVLALTDDRHAQRAYELTGGEAFGYDQLAERLSNVAGRPIRHIALSPGDYAAALRAGGMPEVLVARMLDLERYIREGRTAAVSNDIERVLARAPRGFDDYARESLARWSR